MRLVTIGTGTVALTAARVCAGHYVEAGTARVLLDCGSGVTHRLAELGLPWQRAHARRDHPLSPRPHRGLRDAGVRVEVRRRCPVAARRSSSSARSGSRLCSSVSSAPSAIGCREPGFPLEVREIVPGEAIALDDGTTSARRARFRTRTRAWHIPIERGGRRIVYTGDTGLRSDAGRVGARLRRARSASARCRTRWPSRAPDARAVRRARGDGAAEARWCSRTSIHRSSASTSARSSADHTPARSRCADDGWPRSRLEED